jgi:Tol biopolymer transport system component
MKIEILKSITVILAVVLLINPIVLYIISDSVLIAFCGLTSALLIIVSIFRSKRLKFLGPYVFSLFCTFSILIHAEAVFINNFREYIIEDLYSVSDKYYFNRPNLRKKFTDKEFIVDYVTNKQGFRIGKEDNPDINVEKCDWIFIGDSYTQGAQVEYEDLYTTKLYKSFPNKVVINSGISGWGLPEEFNYYKTEGYKLGAKKIFLQVCNFNDFMNVHEKEASFSDYIISKSDFLRFIIYPFKYANPAELPLGRWTEPFYPTKEMNENFNVFFKKKSDRQKKDLEHFKDFLTKLNNAVRANGAELIVFQIPSKEQLYYKYFEEVINGFHINVEDLNMDFPNEFLSDICSKNSIQYIDLLVPFGEQSEEVFFQYDEHLNKIGHSRLAVVLQSFIADHLKESGGQVQMLSQQNSEDRYPIRHNGNLISYQSVRDSNIELFLADSMLRNSKRLTFNNVDELHPWLDNDKEKIIFTEGNQEEGTTKIGSMDFSGMNRQYITKEGYYGSIPSFNKSHTKIAYPEWSNSKNGDLTNAAIVIINLDTDVKTTITDSKYESWRPIFSANDSCIIYISKRESKQFDIYKYDLYNNTEINLTNSSFDEWDPFISQDDKRIVYAGFKDRNWDIFILELTTGKVQQLTHTLGNEWDASFSPDGKYIYYAGVYGFMNGIYRINKTGRRQ